MATFEALVEGTIKVDKELVPNSMKWSYTYKKKSMDGLEYVENFYITDTQIWFPRRLDKFKKFCNLKFNYNLVKGEPITFEFKDGYELFERQHKVHDSVIEHFKSDINCLVQAPTRFGKSITALGITKTLGTKTLILVDKTLLLNQFIEDGKKFSTVNIGKLEKDKPLYDITVTTFQFLNSNRDLLKQIKNEFGLVIVDELHVSAANTYKRIISSFPSRYRLGLTATPSRSSDGLSNVLYDLFGEIAVIGINSDDMTVEWTVHTMPKDYDNNTYNPARAYDKYFTDTLIVASIMKLVREHQDKTIMIATKSKKVQNLFANLAKSIGLNTCVFNSEAVNKKLQQDNLDKVNKGDITLFTGLDVMVKGVSIPRLEIIINLMGVSSEENLSQLIGRLKTKCEGKGTPLFIHCVPTGYNYKSNKTIEILRDMENVKEVR